MASALTVLAICTARLQSVPNCSVKRWGFIRPAIDKWGAGMTEGRKACQAAKAAGMLRLLLFSGNGFDWQLPSINLA